MYTAATVGLVRYPTTIAPTVGSVVTTAECADNAYRTSSDLAIECTASGSWSGLTPQCECQSGYREVSENGKVICQGALHNQLQTQAVSIASILGQQYFLCMVDTRHYMFIHTFCLYIWVVW